MVTVPNKVFGLFIKGYLRFLIEIIRKSLPVNQNRIKAFKIQEQGEINGVCFFGKYNKNIQESLC